MQNDVSSLLSQLKDMQHKNSELADENNTLWNVSLFSIMDWADNDAVSSKNHRKLVVSSLQLKHLEFIDSLKSLNIEVLCLSAPNLTSFIIYESKFDVEYHSVPSFVDATFGCLYCYHIFRDLDTLSGFSSQLEKLSIRWHMVSSLLAIMNVLLIGQLNDSLCYLDQSTCVCAQH
ncbi:hypothetical protein POM88_054887 [Heracleum sosnowskyi]|uniref:Uncharacterized protein n=1 Tax=Heracleum sosnowskyi TaxID=360622 RepID=A0AAD8LUG2_9APIA|nr:hypothetical protein POM88_054887 [Heracleum sosnowskyi]